MNRMVSRLAFGTALSMAALALVLSSGTSTVRRTYAQEPTPIGGVPENPCETSPATRLQIGDTARVLSANQNAPGLLMREEPGAQSRVLRYLPADVELSILSGPECTRTGDQLWLARIGTINGWVTETSGDDYLLEKAEGEPEAAPSALTLDALACIKPIEAPAAPISGDATRRVVFAAPTGDILLSDNGADSRVIARFAPPPTGIDLSIDGGSALITTPNGVYWLNLNDGTPTLIADSGTFNLGGGARPIRATFLPDNLHIVVEIENRDNNIVTFQVEIMPLDGGAPFRADTGAQPADSLRRSPNRQSAVLLSANDFSLSPLNEDDNNESLLTFTPLNDDGDARNTFMPAVSWTQNGGQFYTFIPKSAFAAAEDEVGGAVWQVGLDGKATSLGRPANIGANDYVIPAPDGTAILAGSFAAWAIRDLEGTSVQALPVPQYIFDWTPDAQGVIFTDGTAKASYLGKDGSRTSAYLPNTSNLFGVEWLSDQSIVFITRDAEGLTRLNIQPAGGEPKALGDLVGTDSYSGLALSGAPSAGISPVSCR